MAVLLWKPRSRRMVVVVALMSLFLHASLSLPSCWAFTPAVAPSCVTAVAAMIQYAAAFSRLSSSATTTTTTTAAHNKTSCPNNNLVRTKMDDDADFKLQQEEEESSRRRKFLILGGSFLAVAAQAPATAEASLLDDFGTDLKITDNRASSSKATEKAKATAASAATTTAEIDPSLRASYYYPTAKKRYLPRIQKVSREIVACNNALLRTGENDSSDTDDHWETVLRFKVTAEDAILPLQLYVSSLDGQGLSQSTQYAKLMRQNAMEYQNAYKRFDVALQKRDSETALQAVSEMALALAEYRQQGRLKDDDGNIPSIDEMKRLTMRRPTVDIAGITSSTP